jgi:benzoate-CoA ligase
MKTGEQFNAATYFVDRHVKEGRDGNTAIECGDARITYGEVLRRVNQLGNALQLSLQVRREERVLLLLPDVPEFAYSFFGAIKIGAVPVPVNTLLKPSDYEYLLNDSRARVAIVNEALLPLLTAIPKNTIPFLDHIVVVGSPSGGAVSFCELVDPEAVELAPATTCKDDVAFWLYSSGSSGPPKGCVHLQHDMIVATDALCSGSTQDYAKRSFLQRRQALLCIWIGEWTLFPFFRRSHKCLAPRFTDSSKYLFDN